MNVIAGDSTAIYKSDGRFGKSLRRPIVFNVSLMCKYTLLLFVVVGFKFVNTQTSPNQVCVYMKECPYVVDLITSRHQNFQQEVSKIICEHSHRYPKVWCEIPCTQSKEPGLCRHAESCPHKVTPEANNDACKFMISGRFVCCPTKNLTSTTTTTTGTPQPTIGNLEESTIGANIISADPSDSNICGIETLSNKIFGGTEADFEDHPWTALLQYRKKGKLRTLCGGTLISKRFVVTAAHCVTMHRAELVNVILGEYDQTSEIDCNGKFCLPKPIVVRIKRAIIHEGWSANNRPFYHDIALLELETPVKYTDYVRPICLSSKSLDENSKMKFTVAGWGKTEHQQSSDVKRITTVNLQPRTACLNTVSLELKEGQLCVGGTEKDSCDGDSGGPLMRIEYTETNPTWSLVGVVSLGSGKCGAVGKPAIYTNVEYYLDWIIDNIK